jgi:hypothetical protein
MATKINVDINVSDNGTAKKSTEAAERLKKTYDAAAKSASKIGASPTMAGAASRATSSAELVEYNRNRSLAMGTGASARDFAKQAEGLGGLVRLYATFAANIFAVSAAFGALSSAMDTTNMIRGLDQLGAATGVALGALSKRLVETTGGAVSIREAMEATVKASAAGIDSSSILRLGKVAQQASVALGVNASDALNRLSRGVVKLEPELLDELGIFTKIDPAVKKYAESVNKAVSELTDFERRQAFLNAVVEEGEQKFSQIEIDTNPYTKLSAALQNTLQNALELINKGLGPIANFLAESPSALTAALVALGSVLVRQALPALGQVRAGLAAAAEEAAETAGRRAQQALAARQKADQIILDQVELQIEKEVAAVVDGQKRLEKLQEKGYSRRTAFGRLLSKDVNELEEKDFQRAESRVQALSKSKKAADQEEAALGRIIINSTRGQIKLTEDLASAKEKAQIKAEQDAKSNTILGLTQRAAVKADVAAKKDALVSNAAYNASLIGPVGAMRIFKAETEKSGLALKGFALATLTARAALGALAGALGTVLSALNGVFLVITIVTTAFALLSGFFTTKEVGAFSSELDNLESTTENLGKTFEKTGRLNPFSEDSLKARSAALIEFSQGLDSTASAAQRALGSLNDSTLANFGNNFLEFFNIGGVSSDFADTFAGSIRLALQEIGDPQIQKEAKAKIESLLKIDPNAADFVKNLREKLKELGPASTEVAAVAKVFKNAGIEAGNAASRITEVKTALDDTRKSFNSLQDSYKIKNPIIEYAENGVKALEKLQAATTKARTPQEAGQAVREAIELQDTVPIFGDISSEELRRKLPDFEKFLEEAQAKVGPNAQLPRDTLVDALGKAFGNEAAGRIAAGLANFNGIIRAQLDVEKKKNENAFKEFALSLTGGFDARTTALEISKAQAELTKVRSEFELAQKGTTPLTATQKEGFEQKIQAANNAVLITQIKEKLAKEKENLAVFTKINTILKIEFEALKAKTELSVLNGGINEENLAIRQKELQLEILILEKRQKLDEISSREKVLAIQVQALRDAGYEAEAAEEEKREKRLLNAEKNKIVAENNLAVKKAELNTELKLIDIQFKKVQNAYTILDLENQIAQVKSEKEVSFEERSLELDIRRSQITRSELIARKQFAAINKAEVDLQKKVQDRTSSYVSTQIKLSQDLAKAKASNNQEEVNSLEKQIELQYTSFGIDLGRIREDSRLDSANKFLDIEEERLNLLDKENSTTREIQDVRTQGIREEQQYNIGIQENRLESLKQIGAVEESRYLLLKNSLEIAKLEFDFENRKKDAITSTLRAIEDSQRRVSGGTLTEEQIALEQNLQEALAFRLGITISKLSAEKTIRQDILAIVGDIAVKDAKRAEDAKKLTDQYKEMADAAKLLGDVFDGFGDRFAETVGGLSSVLQTDLEKRNALEKEYEQKRLIAAEKYRNNESKRRQELLKLQGENADKSLALDAEVVSKASGSFKSLFKEKTAAYKAFSLVEKAAAVTTFALNAQIIASNLATLASRVSAGVAQLFAQGGFAGFAASAAFLALMGSLGIFGGKSVKNTSGPSTEDVQKAQTTGQSFQGGVLTTRTGALSSDPTKTLESIDESLEILKTNSFEELDFSNKNLKTLSNIERNTKGLSEALAIFALSASGNVPTGSKTSGPFGFGGGVLGKGLSLASGALGAFGGFLGGTAGASYLSNLLLNTFGTALTGIASPLTSIITSAFGPVGAALGFLLGKNLDKVLNSVFGGKTTKTLKDVTLTIDGQLNKLSEANSELIKTFAVLQVKIDGGWFRSDKIFDELFQLETPDLVKEYVGSLFKDIKTGIEVAGASFGMDITKVLETFLTEPIKISLKDLKPEEVAEALKNQVSIAFNQIALAGFEPLIKALRDPLEEAGTTLTRLSSQVTLFDQAMSLVGKSVGNITNTLKVVVADDLIELVGGVETFQEKISFFRENFLSEAEQIAPIAEALRKELSSLGVSGTLSRDQFKALVLSQDLATDSGRNTFAALLNVAEAFDTVASAAEEAQSKLDGFVKDIRDFIREQTLDLVKPSQTTKALFQEFGSTVSKSLQGDENSLSYLPDIASQTIESARNSSSSLREFNKLRAGIIGSLGEVASKIESGDLKILTPQEQSNVLLQEIVDNTGNLAQDLAKEIDRQAQITAVKADLLSDPEKLQAAVAASVVEAGDFGSSDVPISQATLDFLAEEARVQEIYDLLGEGEKGPRETRMAAVGQLVGLAIPGASAAQLAGDIIGGKSLSDALASKVDKISLDALGIKAPSLDAIINGISEGAKALQVAGTYVAAQAVNVVQAAKNTVNSLIDAVTGGNSGSSILDSLQQQALNESSGDAAISAADFATSQQTSGNISGDWDGPRLALGGAFNKGIKMFETGGAFTNSVVSNPTMFPLGVMGEAGPEAIMPLTRTSDGSLGVQAELPRFSTQQDKTPETLVLELKELRKEMEKVRIGVETTATGTNKTFRLLDRVAQDGDSLNVVTTSSSLVSIQGIKGGSF